MHEIHIAGHQAGSLQHLLDRKPGQLDGLIITDANFPIPDWIAPRVVNILHLSFDDFKTPGPGRTLATPDQIKEALDWGKDKEKLVVACHQGRSRSSALAFLLAARAWGVARALEILDPCHHIPNDYVVQLGADYLAKPEYADAIRNWKSDIWRKLAFCKML